MGHSDYKEWKFISLVKEFTYENSLRILRFKEIKKGFVQNGAGSIPIDILISYSKIMFPIE